MSAISIGRIVTKLMGREAGRKSVVTRLIDQNFVEISGPEELTGVRRRRVNVAHIDPTKFSIEITKDNNSDEDLLNLINDNSEIKSFMETKLS